MVVFYIIRVLPHPPLLLDSDEINFCFSVSFGSQEALNSFTMTRGPELSHNYLLYIAPVL